MLLRAIVQAIRAALSPHYLTPPIRSRAILDQAGVNPVFRAIPRNSLVPEIANGFTQPTLTRATVATVTDFEGRVIPVVSGEARMHGCRRVRNLLTASDDIGNAAYTRNQGTVSGTNTLVPTGGATDTQTYQQVNFGTSQNGRTFVFRVKLRAISAGFSLRLVIDGRTSGDVFVSETNTTIAITTTARVYTVSYTAASSTVERLRVRVGGNSSWAEANGSVEISELQLEDVTGQSVQAPAEYVPALATANPDSGAIGVRYFSTTNGNVVASNVVTEGAGVPISTATAKWSNHYGVAGGYPSTPDSVANSITGDIDIRICLMMPTWASGSSKRLVCKDNIGASRSYSLYMDSSGKPQFYSSAMVGEATASQAVAFSNGTYGWIRVTRASASGDVKFYTSTESYAMHPSDVTWTQLGSTQNAGAGSLPDSSISVCIGISANAVTSPITGRVYRAAIYNGIAGTLAVDFNPNDYTSGSTFTSATTGEVWTLNGSVKVFGSTDSTYGIPPMFDASGPFGLMPEPVSSNLVFYSQTFSNAWWQKSNTSVSGSVLAPDGTATATQLIEDNTLNTHQLVSTATTITANTTHTVSVYAKANTRTKFRLFLVTAAYANGVRADFDLSAGTVGTATAVGTGTATAATITPMPNGYYRCTVTGKIDAAGTTAYWAINLQDGSGNVSYTGDNTSGLYLWGAQMEAASTVSTYTPTTTAQYQRNAEVHASTCSSFPQGYVEIVARTASYAASQCLWSLDDGTANNRIYVERDSTNMMRVLIVSGGTTQTTLNLGTVAASTSCTVKLSWMGNLVTALLDSNTVQMDMTATIPTITTQHVGCDYSGASQWTGAVRSINVYPKYRTISGRPETDEWLFNARLQAGLMPDYAAGSIYPTFTRADGANGRAVVEDFEGRTVAVNAAEARFRGTRRVRNQLSATTSMNCAASFSAFGGASNVGTVAALGPNGETVSELSLGNAAAVVYTSGETFTNGRTYIASGYVRAKTGTTSVRIGLYDGSGGAGDSSDISITTTWQRVSVTYAVDNTTSAGQFRWVGNSGGTTTNVYVCNMQIEDVTGQSNQNPGPYIPVGAAPLPLASNYLWLPGLAANYASSPDSVVASITGDIDIRVKAAVLDWTPTIAAALISKYLTTGNHRSYTLEVDSTGKLSLTWSTNGTAIITVLSSVATGLTDGSTKWVRATLDVDNGAGGYDVKFYLSDDGTTWTQLGTTQTGGSTTSIYDSAAVLTIGGLNNGAADYTITGRIFRATIASTIGGSAVVDFDPTRFVSSYNGATMTASTGEVWTLNSTGAATMGSGARITNDQAYAFGQWSNASTVGYNGTGIDGVAALDTLPANSVSSNVVTEATGARITSGTAKWVTGFAASSSFSTPDSAAASPTSQIRIEFVGRVSDWTPAGYVQLVNKYQTGSTADSYALSLQTGSTGKLTFIHVNGTTATLVSSSVGTGFTDGTIGAVAVTWDQATGDTKFYTSQDFGATWTQLGTTQAGPQTALNDGTRSLYIGVLADGTTQPLSATDRVYRAKVFATVSATTPAVDFNPNDYTSGSTFASSTTGETWTLNGSVKVYGSTDATYGIPAQWDAKGPFGYLSEGSRTNDLTYSNTLSNAAWTSTLTSLSQNAVGPDGATSAWTLTDSNAGSALVINQQITVTAATRTFSVLVKKTTGAQTGYPVIWAQSFGSNSIALATIDTSNGTATVWTAYTGFVVVTSSATCVSYNADYWLASLTFLPTAAGWIHNIMPTAASTANKSSGTFDVAATGSHVFWNAQSELGAFSSTPIPTTSAAVTRAADSLTYPASGNISGTVGTCCAEVTLSETGSGNKRWISASDATLPLYSGGNYVAIWDGTVGAQSASTLTANTLTKAAASWGGSTMTAYINGAAGTPAAFDGDMSPSASFAVGTRPTSLDQQPFGTIRNVKIRNVVKSALQIADMQA